MASDFPVTNPSFPFDSCNLVLGKGGSGAVFLARHHDTRQLVAVKRCYARRGDRDGFASPSEPPQSPVSHGAPGSAVESQSSRAPRPQPSDDGTRTSDETAGFPLCNEVGMQEESNLEAVHFSQRQRQLPPPGDGSSLLAVPSPPSSPSRSGGAGSPGPAGRVDESSILEYLGEHPHIVSLLGSYTSSRRVKFFAMELMDSDIGRELRAGNAAVRSEEACAVLGFHLLQALQHIHGSGVAHRDVKPGNVFLKRVSQEAAAQAVLFSGAAPYGAQRLSTGGAAASAIGNAQGCRRRADTYVKAHLGDFSAAHFMHGQTMDSTTLATRGTLFYKAPEQLLGRAITDFAACDMWALGCTLLHMYAGEPVFAGTSELQVLLQILHRLGSNFSDFPQQTERVTLFDAMLTSPTPQTAKFVDLLTHLLALDPRRRFTARQALDHPFFGTIRQRQQHLARQVRTTGEGSDTTAGAEAWATPVLLKARLSSTRCPEAAQLRVSFRPVAATPFHKRQRAELERAEVDEFVSAARFEASSANGVTGGARTQRAPALHAATDNVDRETERSESSAPLRDAPLPPPRTSQSWSPAETNSFSSDGPSVHWSQVRSFLGSGDASSLLLEQQQQQQHHHHKDDGSGEESTTAGDAAGDHELRGHGSGGGHKAALTPSGGPAIDSANGTSSSRRLSRPSPLFPLALTSAFTAAVSPTSTCRSSGSGGVGGCRPVLVASSGTAFTASNLRASHDFERTVETVDGRLQTRQAAFVRALHFSSDDPARSPASFSRPQTASASLNGSASDQTNTNRRIDGGNGEILDVTPTARACKMLMFESPSPMARHTARSARAPSEDACAPSAAAEAQVEAQYPAAPELAMLSHTGHGEDADGSDGVDASDILGFDLGSPHSYDLHSCCSSVAAASLSCVAAAVNPAPTARPVVGTAPPHHRDLQSTLDSSSTTTVAFLPSDSSAWSATSTPIPTASPVQQPAGQKPQHSPLPFADRKSRLSVSGRGVVTAPTPDSKALATMCTPKAVLRRKLDRSASAGWSPVPSTMLRESSVNTSTSTIATAPDGTALSALCSPVARNAAVAQTRHGQAGPAHLRIPTSSSSQQRTCRSGAKHADPFSVRRCAVGGNADCTADMSLSLSLSARMVPANEGSTCAVRDGLMHQLRDALTVATAAGQHLQQQRHCTPSLETVVESAPEAVGGSRERSASARFGALWPTGHGSEETSQRRSEELDGRGSSGGGSAMKRARWETPLS